MRREGRDGAGHSVALPKSSPECDARHGAGPTSGRRRGLRTPCHSLVSNGTPLGGREVPASLEKGRGVRKRRWEGEPAFQGQEKGSPHLHIGPFLGCKHSLGDPLQSYECDNRCTNF